MTRRLPTLIGLACAAALAIAGCSSAAPPLSEPPPSAQATGPFWAHECVWNPLGDAVLGEVITVSRGPEGPCEGLELGSTQRFELSSGRADDEVKVTAEVAVAEDGSFSFEIRVPPDLRVGSAEVQAVPNDPACDDPDFIDCPPAFLRFPVGHAPSALSDVTVVSTGLEAPDLPDEPIGGKHYYLPGPADGQVTLVIIGGGPGCEVVPRSYVTTAPSGSLEVVSERLGDACNDVATPWTSVIEAPDEYADFESVKVDNVPAELLPSE